MLHVAAYLWPGNGESSLGHSQVFKARGLYRSARLFLLGLLGRDSMQWHQYDVRDIISAAERAGFKDVRLTIIPLESELRSFLFARK